MIQKIIRALTVSGALCTLGVAAAHAARVDKPTCTAEQLSAATDAYVSAQKKGDISKLPLADDAEYVENMQTITKADGLWNKKLKIAHVASFHDPVRCKTFTEIVVTKGGHPYVIGTRLYMNDGKIIRIDSLVTDKGDWLFNANAYLKYTSKQDWGVLPENQRVPAQQLINAANAYLDRFSDKFTDAPFNGRPCTRLEGGAYTNADNKPDADASCEVGIPKGVLYIVNRDYMVDPEHGVIDVFCRFGDSKTGMPDSHLFRIVNGEFRYIHTLSVNLSDTPSPQSDDNGKIIRNPS